MKDRLQHIIDTEPGTIRAAVAASALDYYDPEGFFQDLMQNGCISGMVPELVYYADTWNFFERHYREIDLLRQETEESLGEPLQVKNDLKNWLAWFAFEETAYGMAEELGVQL